MPAFYKGELWEMCQLKIEWKAECVTQNTISFMNVKGFDCLGISLSQWDEPFQWDEEQEIPNIPWLRKVKMTV